ncbi:BRISC and BRCA1-A complex member 1 isoform X2 [Pristis pectinata]|uniref:BRISC and BRCA1-A complex member 1 isoform X2 n=1 Tax=Pristis pectinata TaxID=685728 RepID=UPI00223D9AEA|nr:BRISC and BRCA1-A complex member 1 isoform X2 [Pristis pectinata]
MSAPAEEGREAPAGSEPEPQASGPNVQRPSTRSNPEGAEDRQDPPGQGAQAGSREGDGEAGTESPGVGGRTRGSRRRQQEQEVQAQAHSLPSFQSQSQPQSLTQAQSQSKFQSQSSNQSPNPSQTPNQAQSQPQPLCQTQSLPQSQSQSQFQSKPQSLPQSQSQPQLQNQTLPQGQSSVLPQSQSQPQFQSQLQFQSQPQPEIQIRTPKVNCPEKVIICLDLSEEMSLQKLESMNGSKTNALNIAQKMIEMFVRTKHKIDKRHEFALVVVNDEVTWLSGFTSDPREVCSCLYDLDTNVCESFDLDGLFSLVQQKIELPVTENVQTIPPPYIVRMILVYIRTPCHPQSVSVEHFSKILQSPYFFFDVIYIYNRTEEMDEEPSYKEAYSFFNNLDTKGTSYKYDVSLTGQAVELHNCMAKLLAHPLQRPIQVHAVYSLLEDDDAVEVEATV